MITQQDLSDLTLLVADFALLGVSETGRIELVTPKVRDIFHLNEGDVEGKLLEELLPELSVLSERPYTPIPARSGLELIEAEETRAGETKTAPCHYIEYLAARQSVTGSYHLKTQICEQGRWLKLSTYKVSHNEKLIFSVLVSDISHQKKIEEELRQVQDNLEKKVCQRTKELEEAKNEAESGVRTKTAFIANMSHEIRTPMNAIIGFAEILSYEKELSKTNQRHIQTILNSAKGLLGIINDILDISKLESGSFALESVGFNLPNALIQILQMVEPQAFDKGLELTLDIDKLVPKRVIGDPTRLRQVILNLVGNAIKFTEVGSIKVTVEPCQKQDYLKFYIKDTGLGMTHQQCQKVFEPFVQADLSTTRKYGGTGLGTTICRQIVELMQGEIWVESETGKGSTFIFTAKLPKYTENGECLYDHEMESVLEYVSPRAFQILLAEDIDTNAHLATLRLEQHGHKIHWAKNGEEAVNALEEGSFDLILMDMMMPVMDGLTATETIRKKEVQTGEHIPIIALTASIMKEDHIRCYEAGVDSIVGKPIDFNELLSAMEQAVEEKRGKLRTAQNIDIWMDSDDDLEELKNYVNVKKALDTWRSKDKYLDALRRFTEDRQEDIEQIAMMGTQSAPDFEKAEEIVHALKGVSGNLFLNDLEPLITKLYKKIRKQDLDYIGKALPQIRDKFANLQGAVKSIPLNTEAEAENTRNEIGTEYLLELLDDLILVLQELNPDKCEPLIGRLSKCMNKTELLPTIQAVENFDFDLAELEANKLKTSLHNRLKP